MWSDEVTNVFEFKGQNTTEKQTFLFKHLRKHQENQCFCSSSLENLRNTNVFAQPAKGNQA